MIAQPPQPAPYPAGFTREEWARVHDLLVGASFAFFAMVDGSRPYVVPMNYAYEPAAEGDREGDHRDLATPGLGRLVLHTGPGRKTSALGAGAEICVAVSCDEAFVQGKTPCSDGYAFRSVLLEGRASLVDQPAGKERALRAIVAKYDPAAVQEPLDPSVLEKTMVYEVQIERISYRELPV